MLFEAELHCFWSVIFPSSPQNFRVFSYLFDGVKVVVDPKSHLYLDQVTLDFKDEIMGRGFVFDNPSASGSCGCGSSFSV